MLNVKMLTRIELLTLMEALTQFGDNASDGDDQTVEDIEKLGAAELMRTQIESVFVALGDGLKV